MTDCLALGSTYRSMVDTKIIDQADVVVAGGGTAGCIAAVAAARQGADVLLIEEQGFLGGMMTAGNAGLTKYIVHEKNQAEYRKVVALLKTDPAAVQVIGGLPMEMTRRLLDTGVGIGTDGQAGSYIFTAQDDFKFMLLTMMEEAGVRLLLHAYIVDVIKEGDAIRAVVIESKSGRQAIMAKLVVDATGDGDVAARAGAPYVFGVGPDDLAGKAGTPLGTTQNMGVMFRMGNIDMRACFAYLKEHPDCFAPQPFALMSLAEAEQAFLKGEMMTINIRGIGHGFQIYNTPIPGVFIFCCPQHKGSGLSVQDLTQAEITMMKEIRSRIDQMKATLPGFEKAYLLDCPEIGVRETRHILGEHVLGIEDILLGKEFPDSIGRGCHPIDIRPIPDWVRDRPLPPRWSFTIPYRCLVPKGVSNLLVAGRCISNTHEASGCTRPTVQCMVTGEAAGVAAAMCVAGNVKPSALDSKELQAKLKAQGVVL